MSRNLLLDLEWDEWKCIVDFNKGSTDMLLVRARELSGGIKPFNKPNSSPDQWTYRQCKAFLRNQKQLFHGLRSRYYFHRVHNAELLVRESRKKTLLYRILRFLVWEE